MRSLLPMLAGPMLAGAMALLAGCGPDDFSRPGTWQATGANEANLRAMVAEPAHLQRGVAATTERAQPATQAIRRLAADRRRPLPDSRAAQIGAITTGSPAPAAPIGGAANAP